MVASVGLPATGAKNGRWSIWGSTAFANPASGPFAEAGVVAFEPRVCPSLAISPCCRSSSLEQGKSDRRGRSSSVLEWKCHGFFVSTKSAAIHRKECSCHGCVKGSARFPASFCVKFRIKKVRFPVQRGSLSPRGGTAWWGVIFDGCPCCFRNAPWPMRVATTLAGYYAGYYAVPVLVPDLGEVHQGE
jgi:hypothetical protein